MSSLEMNPNFDPALNVDEAANYLGMGSHHLNKLARLGRIRSSKGPGVRGRRKFKLSWLNEFLAREEQPLKQTS